MPALLVALSTTTCLQRWQNNKPVDIIVKQVGEKLPDVDELNAKIEKSTWETGMNGPRPPWQHC